MASLRMSRMCRRLAKAPLLREARFTATRIALVMHDCHDPQEINLFTF